MTDHAAVAELKARNDALASQVVELCKALAGCVDSLEYVNELRGPEKYSAPIIGYGVRKERIVKARAALALVKGETT